MKQIQSPINNSTELIDNSTKEDYMNTALKIAQQALPSECPVASLFLYRNQPITSAHNLTNKLNNPLEHAELICLQTLSDSGFTDFQNLTVFVTSEPCIMCADYLNQLNIKNVYYGERNYIFGIHLVNEYIEANQLKFAKVYISPDYLKMLKLFYSQVNFRAPEEIRKTKNKKNIHA